MIIFKGQQAKELDYNLYIDYKIKLFKNAKTRLDKLNIIHNIYSEGQEDVKLKHPKKDNCPF